MPQNRPLKPAEVTTAKELTSWQQFLKANAGKYSGKGWEKKAAADYYTLIFFKRENKRNDDYLLNIPGKPVGSK